MRRLVGALLVALAALSALPVAGVAAGPTSELVAAGERRPALAVGSPAAPAPAGPGLDLDGVVRLALERNPALLAVEARRAEVAGGVREARADAFPQLAVVSSWGRSRNPSLLNSPDFEEFINAFPGGTFEPGEQELYGVGLRLSQPLFTWGKIPAAVDLARLVVDIAEARIGTARLDTALRAAEAYYGLLAERASLQTIRSQEEARRASLAVVQARFELGDATRLELLQAQAALAELLPLIHLAQGRAETAAIELRTLLALEEDPRLAEEPAAGTLPPELAAGPALELALAERPELADLRLQREALDRQQTVTRADGRPQVELDGAYGRTVRLVENLDDPLFADWSVVVALRWDFFDGGRRRGQVEQLESRREQLRLELESAVDRVRLEVEQAIANYRAARSGLMAAEVSAQASVEASRVARESYQEGLALQADWLAAQGREIEAEVLRVRAYYDARVEAARLARVVGLVPGVPWPTAAAAPAAPGQAPALDIPGWTTPEAKEPTR